MFGICKHPLIFLQISIYVNNFNCIMYFTLKEMTFETNQRMLNTFSNL